MDRATYRRGLDVCSDNALQLAVMSDRVLINFRIDRELLDGLKAVAVRDGVPQSEQVRRAIRQWLEDRKAIKSDRKRADTRKRP